MPKITKIPSDTWNNLFHYESPGKYGDYDLFSYGADNKEGGDGEDMDIVSWQPLE
jgi:general secretion pathway protein G